MYLNRKFFSNFFSFYKKYQQKIYFFLVLVIFFTGLILRLVPALTTDLWGDEAISYIFARYISFSDLLFSKNNYSDFVHPTLYYLLLKVVLFVSHKQEFLRIVSVSFYPLTFFVTYKLAKLLDKYTNVLVVLIFFAVHPFLVDLDFQVRMYSMAVFFNVTSLFFIVNHIKQRKSYYLILGGIFLSLAFFTDYLTIWMVFSLCIYSTLSFFQRGKEAWKPIFEVLGFFILISSWQIVSLINHIMDHASSMQPGSIPVLFTWKYFSYELLRVVGFQYYAITTNLIVLIFVFICMLFLGLYKNKNDLIFLFYSIGLGPLIFAGVFSIFIKPIFLARNQAMAIIGIIFLLGFVLKRVTKKKLFFFLLLLAHFFYRSITQFDFYYGTGYSQFTKALEKEKNSIWVIVQPTNEDLTPLYDYYFKEYAIENTRYTILTNEQELNTFVAMNNQADKKNLIIKPLNCSFDQKCANLDIILKNFCLSKNCSYFN